MPDAVHGAEPPDRVQEKAAIGRLRHRHQPPLDVRAARLEGGGALDGGQAHRLPEDEPRPGERPGELEGVPAREDLLPREAEADRHDQRAGEPRHEQRARLQHVARARAGRRA